MKNNKVFLIATFLLGSFFISSCKAPSSTQEPSDESSTQVTTSEQKPTSESISEKATSEKESSEEATSVESTNNLPGTTTVPTAGYALVINGTNYVELTKNDAYSRDGEEWYALGVTLNAGDVVTMYDGTNSVGWAIKVPDSYSIGYDSGAWTGGDNGITCNIAGTYDVYCKLIYENDNIYFGPTA